VSRPSPLNRRSLLDHLWQRFGEHRAMAVYVTVSGFVSIVLITSAASLTNAHLIFPALGPTVFLVFSRPMNPRSSPRNIVLSHLIGWLCGWGSLALFGLLREEAILVMTEFGPARILAVGLSTALTSGILVFFKLEHPPAVSTALIVSIGFLSSPVELVVLMLAVTLVTTQAIVMNRRAGFPYPFWSPSQSQGGEELSHRGHETS
jgi:CBS domain-containing membrane protein